MVRPIAAPLVPQVTPPGLEIRGGGAAGELVIVRRASSAERTRRMIVISALVLVVVTFWLVEFVWLGSTLAALAFGALTAFLVTAVYGSVARLVNRTEIRTDRSKIHVQHGPMGDTWERTAAVQNVAQLFSVDARSDLEALGPFQVRALLHNGAVYPLVEEVVTAEQARAIERRLEAELGIPERGVEGELPRAEPLPPDAAPLRPGRLFGALPLATRTLKVLLVGLVVGGLLATAAILLHSGSELAGIELEEYEKSREVWVPRGKRHIGFFFEFDAEGAGQSVPHVFDVDVAFERDGKRIAGAICNPANWHLAVYEHGRANGRAAKVKIDGCRVELPDGGRYLVRARRVNPTPSERVKFLQAKLIPAAYRTKSAAID